MDRIERVAVPTATLAPDGRTNAYLVGADGAILVDPAERTEALDSAAERRGVNHIVVTHTHADHVGAVADYAETFDATVWARSGREDRFERATDVSPDETLREGTVIRAGNGQQVAIIETPGHAPDHVAVSVEDGDRPTVLAGDLVVSTGSVFVGDEGDMRAYLTSLRRLYARDPAALLPGHGPRVDSPRATLRRLLDHRLDREARVLAAVRGGSRSVDDILDAAYDKDISDVRSFAAQTVGAHLRKLSVEGKVVWDGTVASPR